MTSLDYDLRVLVVNHGFEAVHTLLLEMMRGDYAFLSRVFNAVPPPAPAPVPAAPVVAPVQLPAAPAPAPASPKKVIKVTVRKANEIMPANSGPEPHEPHHEPHDPPLQTPTTDPALQLLSSPTNMIEPLESKTKFRTPSELKAFQKEAEKKKRAELDAKGITADSLLTRENLKTWIEDEGKTYAWVAREMVGCAETQVSMIAKAYGIQSRISKKKGYLIGLKSSSS